MRLVGFENGRMELRWTWLPYWLAAGPTLHSELERLIRDVVIINGMPPTEDSLVRIEAFIIKAIERRFKIAGLAQYLQALRYVREEA
jgi:hypothetical protein